MSHLNWVKATKESKNQYFIHMRSPTLIRSQNVWSSVEDITESDLTTGNVYAAVHHGNSVLQERDSKFCSYQSQHQSITPIWQIQSSRTVCQVLVSIMVYCNVRTCNATPYAMRRSSCAVGNAYEQPKSARLNSILPTALLGASR